MVFRARTIEPAFLPRTAIVSEQIGGTDAGMGTNEYSTPLDVDTMPEVARIWVAMEDVQLLPGCRVEQVGGVGIDSSDEDPITIGRDSVAVTVHGDSSRLVGRVQSCL